MSDYYRRPRRRHRRPLRRRRKRRPVITRPCSCYQRCPNPYFCTDRFVPPTPDEICCPRWVPATGGNVPSNAFIAGYESNGTPLYIARAIYANGLHPGKVRPGFSGANIPYGGLEVVVNPYEVLVWD